ncbi:hypothetical protein CGRA01v4_01825 [Colletotrichum graminicola]|nr:hypothetical protein CGRA01v4_01825 [Colletotrichum graminicola]
MRVTHSNFFDESTTYCIFFWRLHPARDGVSTLLLVGLSGPSSPVMTWVRLGVYGKWRESCCFVYYDAGWQYCEICLASLE